VGLGCLWVVLYKVGSCEAVFEARGVFSQLSSTFRAACGFCFGGSVFLDR